MADENKEAAGDSRGPPSYYHVQEMNKEPINPPPRLSRVPSQYQLESLTEVYVFDIPQLTNNCLQSVALEVNQLELEEEVQEELLPVYAPSEYISFD